MGVDVRRIAKLAMLKIPDEKIEVLEKEMQAIIKMVEHLPLITSDESLLDTQNTMQLREDEVIASYPRELMLQNVPRAVAGCIVVPKTVEE